MKSIKIEIINWSKYNPRRDFKRPVWFALSNRMLEDPSLFDFSSAEIIAWLYILSQASQKNSSVIEIFPRHAQSVCRVQYKVLLSAIDKLEKAQCIQLHVQIAYVPRTDHERHITLQDNTEEQTLVQPDGFTEIYSIYPKKEGKGRGLKIFKREIKTPYDEGLLKSAIEKYAEHCRKNRIEPRFIKQFGTFMADWRSWLDADAGKVILRPMLAVESRAPIVSAGDWPTGKDQILGGMKAMDIFKSKTKQGEPDEREDCEKN